MVRGVATFVVAMLLIGGTGAAQADVAEPPGGVLSGTAAVDIDGDGAAEVATVHEVEEQDPTTGEYVVEVAVRRGTDGTPLWRATVPAGGITLVPANVGPGGARGLYLLVSRFNFYGGISSTEDGVTITSPVPFLYGSRQSGLDVYAMDPAGQVLWEKHFTGERFAADPTRVVGTPLAVSTLRATPSAADDLVLVVGDAPLVITQQNNNEATYRASVLEGTDGSVASSATLAENATYTSAALTTGDFDADGAEDYAVQVGNLAPPGAPARVSQVVAHRGTDSARLWGSDGDFFELRTIGDVTGDGVRDVLASSSWFSLDESGTARLIDGRSGTTRAEVAAGDAWPTSTGFATATRYQTTTQMTLELAAYDGRGVNTAIREIVVQGQANASTRDLGDVNHDGVDDLTYTITAGSGETATEQTAVVDGATLGTLWSQPGVGQALGATVGGDGDDLLTWEPWGRYAVDVTVQRGRSGAPVWSSRLIPDAEETEGVSATAADVNGDGRAEVLVQIAATRSTPAGEVPDDLGNGRTHVTELHLLDGRTGAALWRR